MPTDERTATLAEKRQELKKIGQLKSFTIPSKEDLEKAESLRTKTTKVKSKLRNAELELHLAKEKTSYTTSLAPLTSREEELKNLIAESTAIKKSYEKKIATEKNNIKKLDKDAEGYQERKQQIKDHISAMRDRLHGYDQSIRASEQELNDVLRLIAALEQREGITPLKVKVNKYQEKSKELYQHLNQLPKATTNVEDFFVGAGYYKIKQANSQQITYIGKTEDFETNGIDLTKVTSLKLIDTATAEFLGFLTKTSSETRVSAGELLAIVETKAYDQLNLTPNVAIKVEALANSYARCGVKGGVLMAEIGANTEASVGIGNDTWNLNLKSYAKAKAGVYASLFGVMASAESEVGSEIAGAVQIGKKDGAFSVAIEAKASAYGKAEAKAGLGATNGKLTVGAVAGIQVGVKGSLGGKFFTGGVEVGGIAGEIDIAAEVCSIGAVVEGEFSFKQAFDKELEKIGQEVGDKESKVKSADPKAGPDGASEDMIEIKIGLLADAAVLVGAKAKIDLIFNINRNSIKTLGENIEKVVIKAIENIFNEAIAQKFKEVLTEIKVYANKVRDFKDRTIEDIHNKLKKGVILIQTADHQKIKLEIDRQLNKLNKFRNEIEKLKDNIEQAEVDNKGIVEMTDEIRAKLDRFNDKIMVIIDNGYRIDTENVLKEYLVGKLTEYIERYDRRIDKLNQYVSSNLDKYFPLIEQHCADALTSINNYESADNKQDAKKEINDKVKELDKLLKTFDRLIGAKQDIIDSINFHNDDRQLAGQDAVDLENFISTKYNDLKDHIEELKTKLTELQNIVKQE